MQQRSAENRSASSADVLAFAKHLEGPSRDDLIKAVFEGWNGDYGAGRALLLARLSEVRSLLENDARLGISERLFATLVELGEDTGDMRLVHLGVESRDMIRFGY